MEAFPRLLRLREADLSPGESLPQSLSYAVGGITLAVALDLMFPLSVSKNPSVPHTYTDICDRKLQEVIT